MEEEKRWKTIACAHAQWNVRVVLAAGKLLKNPERRKEGEILYLQSVPVSHRSGGVSGVDTQGGSEPAECLDSVLVHGAGDADDVVDDCILTQTQVSHSMSAEIN